MNIITEEKLEKYFGIADAAIEKIRISIPENSHLHSIASDFLRMAEDYISDAHHFHNIGDSVNAFAALNYAHGWMDAGARLGLFDVENDWKLFTLKE